EESRDRGESKCTFQQHVGSSLKPYVARRLQHLAYQPEARLNARGSGRTSTWRDGRPAERRNFATSLRGLQWQGRPARSFVQASVICRTVAERPWVKPPSRICTAYPVSTTRGSWKRPKKRRSLPAFGIRSSKWV